MTGIIALPMQSFVIRMKTKKGEPKNGFTLFFSKLQSIRINAGPNTERHALFLQIYLIHKVIAQINLYISKFEKILNNHH